MGLLDLIQPVPKEKKDIASFIAKEYKHIGEAVQSNPQYQAALEKAVEESMQRYTKYLGNITGKVSGAGHVVGYAADAWLLGTGDIVGSLGGKFLNLLAQIPEKAYGLVYGVQTGNYLDTAQNILEGVISYIPGFTFVDQGLERIIRKRIVKDAASSFEKMIGEYKPWTAKVSEAIKDKYTGVRDRTGNVFSPGYQPGTQPAYAMAA